MKRGKYIREALPLIWPYILMSVIMLALFTYGIFAYFRVIASDAEQEANNRIDVLSNEVYTQITSFRKACDVLSASNAVLSFPQAYGGDANTVQEAILSLQRELSNVVSIANFSDTDVEVYYPKEQVIVSIKGVYRGGKNSTQRLEDQSGGALQKAFPGMNPNNAWSVCYNDGRAWLIRQMTDHRNTIAYIILEFALDQLVPLVEGEGFAIIGDDDSLLYTSEDLTDDSLITMIRGQVRDYHRFSYNGGEYVAYRCIFSVLRTEITIAISINQIIANTTTFLKTSLLLGAICAACLALIFMAMYRRVIVPYRYLAETTWADSETGNSRDILTLARSNLLSLKSQQEAAEEEKKLLIHLGVGDLIQQVRTLPQDSCLNIAKRCLSLTGILPGQRYMVFAVFFMDGYEHIFLGTENAGEETPLSVLDSILRDILFTGRIGAIATLERYYVIIATCQDGDTEEKLNGIVNLLTDVCQEQYGATLAVTRPFIGNEPEDLRKHVRHTMNDVNYLYFWRKKQIGSEEDGETEQFISFFKAMRNLINRLDSQDYPGAKATFAQIMEENLPRTAQNFQITKYRIYGMVEMLLAAIYEETSLGEDTIRNLDFEKRLYEADNLPFFRSTTEQIFMELIDIRKQCDSGEGSQKKIESIKAYIDMHYTENGLTATSVAEHFRLSGPYVSREFKRIVGCNMLEYIQKLRIEQVKKLLMDHSVKDAAQKAGFWDSQSLVRVFKKYEGITPGEYKKALQ